jgi:hypothetical protein
MRISPNDTGGSIGRCRRNRVNAIALAPAADFRRDSYLFGAGAQTREAQSRFRAALKHGFQTRDAEMDLATLLGKLPDD